ncbi:MAG TPA: complex I NDUFA9 subunit family protein [Alphaproteobacteria bacterium]|nr:complex I NDUFA9 subunit family protein [Alphaproteobacteria bacterium]
MTMRAPYSKVATVFGGSGFIGRYVVRELASRGWRVRVATRDPGRALFLKPMGAVGQIVPIFANIRDDASVTAAVAGADYIVNLVGVLYEKGKATFAATHLEGARRIARAAAEAGCERVIHISAVGASPSSDSLYARTKAAGEQAVLNAFAEATILRPSVVFGPEDGFFNRFASIARLSPFLPLIGGGQTRFQPVYVGDVADAVMACLDRPETKGRTYELGGPKVYTFKELMELLLREINRRRILLPVPWSVAEVQGSILGALPKPLLTRDQVSQLRHDNVVTRGAQGLQALGITPTAVEIILPTYMDRFKIGGRFSRRRPTAGMSDLHG